MTIPVGSIVEFIGKRYEVTDWYPPPNISLRRMLPKGSIVGEQTVTMPRMVRVLVRSDDPLLK